MGVRERREREKDLTRQKILDAARDLFVEQGYDAVTLRRIAQAIEYSPTAIYGYFKTKAELMKALCARDFEAFAANLSRFADVPDPVERILLAGQEYLRFAMEHPNQFRFMFMTKPAPEAVTTDEGEMSEQGRGDPNRDAYAFLMECVRQAIAQNRVREDLQNDADLVVQMLWAGVHGVASLHIARAENDPWFRWKGVQVLGEAMCQAILRGILRDPPARLRPTSSVTPPATSSRTPQPSVPRNAP
ncbi:MAG TPA: TetR/AcrR family transcriptional regulator [Phycisphaerae bacterium]|nr:TetR/AcrR family transcriptional regulator [Phycisphaerae bacterium]